MVHNKIPPTISLSAAALLALASPQQYSANAAIADKENEVESILNRMVSDALLFRDEIIRAYRLRCETETLTECARNNYNDCSSTFPNQQCMKKEELVVSACGDGESCNGEYNSDISMCLMNNLCRNAFIFYQWLIVQYAQLFGTSRSPP